MPVVNTSKTDEHKNCQPSPHIHPTAQPGTATAGQAVRPGQAGQGLVGAAHHHMLAGLKYK